MAARKKTSTHVSATRKKASAKATSKAQAAPIKNGAKLQWAYGAGKAIGKVLKVFKEKITLQLKGATVTRNATPEKPAVLMQSDQGGKALKSKSELKTVSGRTRSRRR